MKITTAFVVTSLFTILAIIIANVVATEYRIKREREEEQKKLQNGAVCPPCPACNGTTQV